MRRRLDQAADWLLNPPEGQGHRRVAVIAIALGVLLLVTASFSFASMAYTVVNANNTAAIERGADIQGCRSLFNSRLVGDATTSLQIAEKEAGQADRALSRSRAALDVIETDLLRAAAFGDETSITAIAEQFEAAQLTVQANVQSSAEREAEVDARADEVEFGRSEYNALIELSNSDPDAFLAACERSKEEG